VGLKEVENPATPIRVERAMLNSLPLVYQAMAEIWASVVEVIIVDKPSKGEK
jgi:hypothetical protein